MSGLQVSGCTMRALGADETTPLEAFMLDNVHGIAVTITGLGHLIVVERRDDTPIDARTIPAPSEFVALFTQGPGRESPRDVLVFDDRLEVEILPSKSVREWHPPQKREERLLVTIPRGT
jgi:hypothetical protein